MKKLQIILATAIIVFGALYSNKAPHPLAHQLQVYSQTTLVGVLGYDPHITLYPAIKTTVHDEHVTVYVHGWGESQKIIPFLQANTDLLPGHVVGFDFKSALIDSAKKSDLLKTNFCQSDDIAAL